MTRSRRLTWLVLGSHKFVAIRYILITVTRSFLSSFLSPININALLGLLHCFAVLRESLPCWLTEKATNVYGHKYQQYVLTYSSPKYSIGLCIHAWRSWLRHYASSRKIAGSTPDGVIGIFIYIILPVAIRPGVEPASNRNEHQEHFLRGKYGWCLRLTTTFLCWLSRNSGSRNFLDCFTFTCASTLNVFSPYCYLRACCRLVYVFTNWCLRISLASKWPVLEAI